MCTGRKCVKPMNENLSGNPGSFKTLIVEDNATFRRLLKDLLLSQFPFMSIEEAGDGQEAIGKIADCDTELVFMDIQLPDASGLWMTSEIKNKCPDTEVIILTSYDLPEYREAATESGAAHFVPKEMLADTTFLNIVQSTISRIRRLP